MSEKEQIEKRGTEARVGFGVENIRLSEDEKAVVILDQSQLPNETVYLRLEEAEDFYDAIYTLKVRGAPAIGIFAAYAIFVLSRRMLECGNDDYESFLAEFKKNKAYLDSSRPTAVNLSKMLRRMEAVVLAGKNHTIVEIVRALKEEAEKIQQEDIMMCRAIAEYGLTLVKDGDGILTHCNAGPLATSRYGTGLAPFFLGKEHGITLHAWIDETRPLLQGARLTAYELCQSGIDCTLICDNMASLVMREGKINACFVGCDRVAANGDTANKIGTSSIAILAQYYKIPFYVFCPSETVDFSCRTGADIEIEMRPAEEIKTKFFERAVAPAEVRCYNPAFDVTDHELITAIVTEKGICRSPYKKSLHRLLQKTE